MNIGPSYWEYLQNLPDADLIQDALKYPSAVPELIRRYENKKAALKTTEALLKQKGKECEGLKKLSEDRVRRQVQLHSRNMELKEQIYKAIRALDPSSYRDS